MREQSESTVSALDGVLQTFWGEILEDQTLSDSHVDRLQKACNLIMQVKAELEAEEDLPPLVPAMCCLYCGKRDTSESGEDLFCPVKGRKVSADYVCDSFKILTAKETG
jgi:hypothetical protein